MILKNLIQKIVPTSVEGSLDREVTGITYDSRRVTPGMLFVAIPGFQTDGHDFISAAIDRGAVAVLHEKDAFFPQRATQIKVPDVRAALAEVAAAFYGHPASKLKMIGITGTNGKTTVAFMVKHLLETAGLSTGLVGTVRYEIGERIIPAHRTTPEALEIHDMLAQMVRAGCAACVMEVSSHALEQKRVLGIEFDAVLFTNLTQDHLDYHGTMERYFEAKNALFAPPYVGGKPSGTVINIDDSYGQRLAEQSRAQVRLTYGLGDTAQIRATQIQLGPTATRMRVDTPACQFSCELPLIGRHNVYNALAAVGAGLVLNIRTALIRSALESLQPVPGRLERIPAATAFAVYVDYAHTDDALHHVLSTLRELTPGKILLTFGCGGSRDTGKRVKMGRVAAALADFTVITSDNPRKESPAHIAAQIEEGFQGVGSENYRIELDRARAIEEIIRMARPGDAVLIAGKGHETYQEFEDTIVPFDDRVQAGEVLETLRANLTAA